MIPSRRDFLQTSGWLLVGVGAAAVTGPLTASAKTAGSLRQGVPGASSGRAICPRIVLDNESHFGVSRKLCPAAWWGIRGGAALLTRGFSVPAFTTSRQMIRIYRDTRCLGMQAHRP